MVRHFIPVICFNAAHAAAQDVLSGLYANPTFSSLSREMETATDSSQQQSLSLQLNSMLLSYASTVSSQSPLSGEAPSTATREETVAGTSHSSAKDTSATISASVTEVSQSASVAESLSIQSIQSGLQSSPGLQPGQSPVSDVSATASGPVTELIPSTSAAQSGRRIDSGSSSFNTARLRQSEPSSPPNITPTFDGGSSAAVSTNALSFASSLDESSAISASSQGFTQSKPSDLSAEGQGAPSSSPAGLDSIASNAISPGGSTPALSSASARGIEPDGGARTPDSSGLSPQPVSTSKYSRGQSSHVGTALPHEGPAPLASLVSENPGFKALSSVWNTETDALKKQSLESDIEGLYSLYVSLEDDHERRHWPGRADASSTGSPITGTEGTGSASSIQTGSVLNPGAATGLTAAQGVQSGIQTDSSSGNSSNPDPSSSEFADPSILSLSREYLTATDSAVKSSALSSLSQLIMTIGSNATNVAQDPPTPTAKATGAFASTGSSPLPLGSVPSGPSNTSRPEAAGAGSEAANDSAPRESGSASAQLAPTPAASALATSQPAGRRSERYGNRTAENRTAGSEEGQRRTGSRERPHGVNTLDGASNGTATAGQSVISSSTFILPSILGPSDLNGSNSGTANSTAGPIFANGIPELSGPHLTGALLALLGIIAVVA